MKKLNGDVEFNIGINMNDINERIEELRGKLQINQFDLENECVNQPIIYDEVGQLATDAKSNARLSKDNLDYTKASIEMEIRSNPEKFGIAKITESSVDAAVKTDQRYIDASVNYINAQKLADSLTILLSAAEQRKSMIKDLVSLYIYSYYQQQYSGGMHNEIKQIEGATTEEIINKRKEIAKQRRDEIFGNEVPNERE